HLSHSLLRLKHTVVIQQRNNPTVRGAIDQILNITRHLQRRRIGEDMREHVGGEGRDAFVFTKQVRHGHENNASLSNFIDRHERIAGGYSYQSSGAPELYSFIPEDLSMKILRFFARRETSGVMRFAGGVE